MNKRIKSAGSLIFLSYIGAQGVRFLANILVARLLAPEMFGVMAIVLMIQQGVIMMSDVGINAFVMRHTDYRKQSVMDTVWTIQVIRGWLLWACIIFIAIVLWVLQQQHVTNTWGVLNRSELPTLIAVTSITAIFSGYKSLASLIYARELNRLKIELTGFVAQLVGTVIMIVWAWQSPSIWALASAGIASALISLWFSYQFFEIRHHFRWDRNIVVELYHFGKWIFIATALTFIAQQGDRMFLSINLNATQLGLYSIAITLTGFAVMLIDKLTSQLWLPVFSQDIKNIKRLKERFYKIRLMQDLLVSVFVFSVGLASTSLINFIYDERYQDVAWMLRLMLAGVVILTTVSTTKVLLVAMGETKVQMQVMFTKLLSLVVLMPMLFYEYAVLGIIMAVLISSLISKVPQYIHLRKWGIIDLKRESVIFLILLIYIPTAIMAVPS